jgi:UDPglucose 6-dehydrogenase
MKVAVVGAGYVGLVSGVCLSAKGHTVACVDLSPDVVAGLNRGTPHIYERGLEALLQEVRGSGRFSATTDLNHALQGADVAIIAVGTPSEDGVIDLRYVRAAARDIGRHLAGHDRFLSVIVKSTVIPGTTDTVVRQELEQASGRRLPAFGLGMNPEFLREGEAIEDFNSPDRIVLGHEDARTLALLEELYAPWGCDKVRVNTRTAEMIKYANNALLATQISAINEIANLAAALGEIDVMHVVQGVSLDKRWSPIVGGNRIAPQILSYLIPGCGFGGSCFPKDVQALRSQGEQQGLPMHMLNAVLGVNEAQPAQVLDILERELGSLRDRRCLVLGLAFKPETDDVRESASLRIVAGLIERGAQVTAHDPIAAGNFRQAMGASAGAVAFVEDWQAALAEAEVAIVATKWNEYRRLASVDLANTLLFDARRLFAPGEVRTAKYLTIGRRIAAASS